MALTDRAIQANKPGDKPYKVFDGTGLGLYLLITPNGSKLWRLGYDFDGKEKTASFGEYPRISLKDARKLANEAQTKRRNGIDPMAKDNADSFETIARQWWKWWSEDKSPRHADSVLKRLEADVFPAFGAKSVEAITAKDIRNMILEIEKRGARDVAKRSHETTGQIFRYACANGLATRNPARDFNPSDVLRAAKEENFARVDAKDLPALLAKLWDYDGDAITRLALRLMAYCFTRTSELIEAPWSEFNLENAEWRIPAHRMKMRTEHIVPLSRQAVEVLRALHQLTGNRKLVFPGANDKNKAMSNNTILFAIYRLGYKGKMTGHGFRSVASTILHEQGFDERFIEVQLAHQKRNKVAAAYDKSQHLAERISMMQAWADFLDSQLAKGREALAA